MFPHKALPILFTELISLPAPPIPPFLHPHPCLVKTQDHLQLKYLPEKPQIIPYPTRILPSYPLANSTLTALLPTS